MLRARAGEPPSPAPIPEAIPTRTHALRCNLPHPALRRPCLAPPQLAWGGGAAGKRAAIEAGAMPALALVLATHTGPQHHNLQQMARAIMEELDKAR